MYRSILSIMATEAVHRTPQNRYPYRIESKSCSAFFSSPPPRLQAPAICVPYPLSPDLSPPSRRRRVRVVDVETRAGLEWQFGRTPPRGDPLHRGLRAHDTQKHGRLVEGGRVSMPLPQSCALLRAVDPRFPHSLDIFDFSERHAMRRAAEARPITRRRECASHMLCMQEYMRGKPAGISCRWWSGCAASRSAPRRCWCCPLETRCRSPSGARARL